MDSKKTNKEQKLEKELKTLVSRMKSENSALNKILVQLKSDKTENPVEKAAFVKPAKNQK